MGNCILMEITSAEIWANITGWISRQILAVSGFARIDKNDVKSELKRLQKIFLTKIPAGKSCKPLRALGLSGSKIKKQGFFAKKPKGVNLLYMLHQKTQQTRAVSGLRELVNVREKL